MTRERLAEMVQRGLVTPTGLISHGRGEAYDYLMGERSTEAALEARGSSGSPAGSPRSWRSTCSTAPRSAWRA